MYGYVLMSMETLSDAAAADSKSTADDTSNIWIWWRWRWWCKGLNWLTVKWRRRRRRSNRSLAFKLNDKIRCFFFLFINFSNFVFSLPAKTAARPFVAVNATALKEKIKKRTHSQLLLLLLFLWYCYCTFRPLRCFQPLFTCTRYEAHPVKDIALYVCVIVDVCVCVWYHLVVCVCVFGYVREHNRFSYLFIIMPRIFQNTSTIKEEIAANFFHRSLTYE